MFYNAAAEAWQYKGPASNPDVESFHRGLPDYAITPLVSLPEVAKELGLGHVLLKDESNRLGLPAFKILGASWAVFKTVAIECGLPLTSTLAEVGTAARERDICLVTCTEGNWGRALSRVARYLQCTATIFVPNFMDKATQEKISGEGGKVIVVDGDYDYSVKCAKEEAERHGLLVMDVSWEGYEEIPELVVDGYMTMLTETDRQLQGMGISPATHAIPSVGAGSWAQAVVIHYKSHPLAGRVIAVEPITAASLKTSLEAGAITSISTGHTIMNGMNCGTISSTAWLVLREGLDASVTVSDVEVHHDLQMLHSRGIKVGPCGAAPLSALRRICMEKKQILQLDRSSVVILFSTEGAREYVVPDGA
ncbi:tryptophan synthase beta subunit-like PLP-dependent enzyme [Paraphoma chrysanthemicola]|uniref:Tryptophan synthase beta subunit-like PLP-dependent enzyme n=1 Tax=Paraphoma chrysanthemicola TaxID=798071 RepID=A0A8K0W1S6_9PLEO|nr:tryptophan synthase beta subunit-like PLP-dependent enzyme [Paraphoma chrysanthemicola]